LYVDFDLPLPLSLSFKPLKLPLCLSLVPKISECKTEEDKPIFSSSFFFSNLIFLLHIFSDD
ncbi:hypothetical protein, partial [Acinetobacter baumannii]|uniref:hypothetical protein n=1 Tax=Acinetobacter baumannii TaxID=470 RepID=UPI0033941600